MIIVIGKGILGSATCDVFKQFGYSIRQLTREDFDLATVPLDKIKNIFKKEEDHKFDLALVINTAAFTDVSQAEYEKDICFKTNAEGPYKLAVVCKQLNIPFMHISTDFIFDGHRLNEDPYVEYDTANPINWYGYTKFIGEQMVINSGCDFSIIRTGWLYNCNRGVFLI